MLVAPLAANEPERLAALQRYEILDTPSEAAFDRITALASRIFDMPIVLISLIDQDRQWFKSCYGLSITETSRELAFCSHTILSDATLVIKDAALDERFADNPLVTGEPFIRFYAGMPLHTHDGYNLGSLCLIDRHPREFSSQEQQNLEDLTKVVSEQLELRRLAHRQTQIEAEIDKALIKERELNDLKSRFISMTSHEFRTPLSIILSSAELLEFYRQEWPDSKISKYLQQIQKAIIQVSDLLRDMLTLSQSEATKLEFKPAPLDLQQFCRDLVTEHFDIGETARINFIYSCPDILYQLDERLLRQILINLLTNALKYSHLDREVHLEVNCQADILTVSVQDSGIGIPVQDQPHLFELFHRATNVGSTQGTGLGLAIAKKSVEAHNGQITFSSQEGKGTTFTVRLPLAPTP